MAVRINAGTRNDIAELTPRTLYNNLPSTGGGASGDARVPRYEDYVALLHGGVSQAAEKKEGEKKEDKPPANPAPIDPTAIPLLDFIKAEQDRAANELRQKVENLHSILMGYRAKVKNPGPEDKVDELKKKIEEKEAELEKLLIEGLEKGISFSFDPPEPVAERARAKFVQAAQEKESAERQRQIAETLAVLHATGSPSEEPPAPPSPPEPAPPAPAAPTTPPPVVEAPPEVAAPANPEPPAAPAPEAPPATETAPTEPPAAPEATKAAAPTITDADIVAALAQPDFSRASQEVLLNKEVQYGKRANYMARLTDHYNTQSCTPEVRAEILEVFNWALTHADPEVFYAGFSAVTSLNDDEGLALTRKYVFEYAKHRRAKDSIGTDNVDNRFAAVNTAAIRRAFILEPVNGITQDEIVEAISRVLVKFNEPENLSIEQLWISALVEVVGIDASKKDIVVGAITNRVQDNQKTDRAKKVEIMHWLVEIYRSAATDPEKQAVIAIFENVRGAADKNVFYAGLSASTLLSLVDTQGLGEMTKYMATFAKHTSDKSDVSTDSEAVTAYKDAIGKYAYASALQHKGFSNDDIEAALLRLVAKVGMYDALTGGDLDVYRLLAGIEGLKDKPDIADPVKNDAVETAIKDGVKFDDRVNLFVTLALLYNTDTTNTQRGVIASVFNTAMSSNKEDVYFAGLSGAGKLHDEGHVVLSDYILNMAGRYAANDPIVSSSSNYEPNVRFNSAIMTFTEIETDRMRGLINGINEMWFANPQQKVLWTALMDISALQKQCYVDSSAKREAGKPAPAKMSFRQAVRDAFITSFGALPDEQKNAIAETSTQYTLDPASSQSLPVELVDYLIENGSRVVRMNVINALNHAELINRDLVRDKAEYEIKKAGEEKAGKAAFSFAASFNLANINTQTENAVEQIVSQVPEQTLEQLRSQDRLVRFYLALMEKRDVRTEAIINGGSWHNLSALLIYGGYLTRAGEPENYRDRAHAFFRDTRPVGADVEAPIAEYGIHRIRLIEDKTAGAQKGEIAKQCKKTIELLYAEWRKRNARWTASLGLVPSDTSAFSDSPTKPVLATPGLELRLGRAWAANEDDRRGYLGGYINLGIGKFAAGVSPGFVWDLSRRASLSTNLDLGFLKLWGDEPNGDYQLNLIGAEVAFRPQISFTLSRWKWHRAANFYFAPRIAGFYGNAEETTSSFVLGIDQDKDENRFGYSASIVFGGAVDFGK